MSELAARNARHYGCGHQHASVIAQDSKSRHATGGARGAQVFLAIFEEVKQGHK